jgi:hypothetical protein
VFEGRQLIYQCSSIPFSEFQLIVGADFNESIHNVGAQEWIHVGWHVFPWLWSVLSPV